MLLGHEEVGTRKVGDDDDVFCFFFNINVSVLCVICANVGTLVMTM